MKKITSIQELKVGELYHVTYTDYSKHIFLLYKIDKNFISRTHYSFYDLTYNNFMRWDSYTVEVSIYFKSFAYMQHDRSVI